MFRTQVYLTEAERSGVSALAERTGKKQSEIIREAIDRMLESASSKRRDAVLNRAAGMWRDRTDLPDSEEQRQSWDRS